MKRSLVVVMLFVFSCVQLHAQEWQWSIPVRGIRKNNPRAWLWIPPACKQVKGVVVAQHNMEEIAILEDPVFRENYRHWILQRYGYHHRLIIFSVLMKAQVKYLIPCCCVLQRVPVTGSW